MMKVCFLVLALIGLNSVLILAAPGEKGVCSANCENAGASCVIDMERSSESCGKCSQGTTIFQSCYIPNGECSKMCTKSGASCEVGRDLRVSECGDCLGPDGAQLPVEDACTPVPNGRCDTACGNPLASCSPSLTVVPAECGGCPTGMSPEIACREDYGRCSTKCTNKGQSCKPDLVEVPRECGTCSQEVTPAESCTTPPDGVCSDQCSRARAECTQALPGTTAMPAACGACFVNAQEACLPLDAKCRISMANSDGSEVVPIRVEDKGAVYQVQGKSKGTVKFKVIQFTAGETCGTPMTSMDQSGKTSIKEITSTVPGAKMYEVSATLPTMKSGRAIVTVEGCCGDMMLEVYVPGGGSCTAWGDPHYITFDQMRYSYMGAGDYDMVVTLPGSEAAKEGGDLSVQFRFVPMYSLKFDKNSDSWYEKLTSASKRPISTVRAVAAKEAGLQVAMYVYHYSSSGRARSSVFTVARADGVTNAIDARTMTGSVAELIPGMSEYGTLKVSSKDVTVDFAKTGTQLKINSFDASLSMSTNIAVRANPLYYSLPGSVRGLCGDCDGNVKEDVHSKLDDGHTFSQRSDGNVNNELPEQDEVCVTWKVPSEYDSLFDYDGVIAGVQPADIPTDSTMLPSFKSFENPVYTAKQVKLQNVPLQSKTRRLFGTDPLETVDPALVSQAQEACALLQPPFANEIDFNNCIGDFIVAIEATGDVDASIAAVGSIVDAHEEACQARVGNDNDECKASGAGCEDLNGCSNQGKCVNARCECVVGATGDDCSIPAACDLDTSCGKHGKCVRSQSGSRTYDCDCDTGFGGDQCEYVITSDGKVLKLAGGVAEGTDDTTQSTFVATTSKGVSTGVLAGIAIAFVLIAGGVIGGAIYYRKSQPVKQSNNKGPMKQNTSSNSVRSSSSVQILDRPSTPSKGRAGRA